jgi:hypothetical protein
MENNRQMKIASRPTLRLIVSPRIDIIKDRAACMLNFVHAISRNAH